MDHPGKPVSRRTSVASEIRRMNLLWAILAGHSSKGMELAGQHNESAREPPSRQLMSRYGQQVAAKEHGEAQGSYST
ncbi:hypothetical protein CRG98_000297 [Punica granatum]|uniref:Uncharacterized protein n=1 Tax=Punica granatum TaxID=22663 RepID=A0A2I0LF49_PUNGR|nr:hypothetical protein CRG98_000297 [Punica granatum]